MKALAYIGVRKMDSTPARVELAEKPRAGELREDEYDKRRYNYPKYDTMQHWAKVPRWS